MKMNKARLLALLGLYSAFRNKNPEPWKIGKYLAPCNVQQNQVGSQLTLHLKSCS